MKTRIITAVVALLIVIPLVLLGGIYFELLMCLVGALAFKEMIDLKKSHGKIPNMMIFIGLVSLLSLILSNNSNLSIYFLLDLLYASYFSLDYENNFNKKLQLTSKSESTRHSSNPILMDESKQC